MRMDRLDIRNFRCFGEQTFSFHPHSAARRNRRPAEGDAPPCNGGSEPERLSHGYPRGCPAAVPRPSVKSRESVSRRILVPA